MDRGPQSICLRASRKTNNLRKGKKLEVKAVFKITVATLAAVFASAALSQDVQVVSVINVKTTNPQGYTQYLADHPQIMSSLGAQAGGTCLTVSGHRYPNQAFAWTIFPNAATAFKAARMYSQAPANPELDALRVKMFPQSSMRS